MYIDINSEIIFVSKSIKNTSIKFVLQIYKNFYKKFMY
jgi:hypothetical protein